jgi:hypothetical protein
MAEGLGGKLETPHVSWKYSWISGLFGPDMANRAQVFLRRMKWSFLRSWDRALFRIENHRRKNAFLEVGTP